MKPQLSPNFIEYYLNVVKPVALKCCELFPKMKEIETGKEPSQDDPEVIKIKALKDGNAAWYIGLMVGDIEKALIGGTSLNLINSVGQVHGCLTSESYWKNVWNDDVSTEEAKNIKKLAGLMPELLQKL